MEKRLKLSEDNILKTAKSVAEGIIHYEAETFDGKEYIMCVNPMQKCKVCDAANGVESLYPAKLYVDFVGLEEKREKVFEIRRRFYAEGQEYLLLQDEKEELYLRAYQEKEYDAGKFKILLSNADAGIGRILGAGLKVNYQDSGDVCINQCNATEAEIQTFVEALRAYEGIPIPDDGIFGQKSVFAGFGSGKSSGSSAGSFTAAYFNHHSRFL